MLIHIAIVGLVALVGKVANQEEKLEKIFNEGPSKTPGNGTCNTITSEATPDGCYECYLCDHPSVQRHSHHTLQNFTLVDENCEEQKVCCVSQVDLNDYRSYEKCGIDNPEGEPRQIRPKLRSVLQGQYPWRAWVYNKDLELLCAASYVDDGVLALITPASCLMGQDEFTVRFHRRSPRATPVREVRKHPQFDPKKGINDIAILVLESLENVPAAAQVACLPVTAPTQGAGCTAVSDDEMSVNTVIPKQALCNETRLHQSNMCAVTPRHDYEPEMGGGLFCLEEDNQNFRYILYGMLTDKVEIVGIYTNVTNHLTWLNANLKELRNLKGRYAHG